MVTTWYLVMHPSGVVVGILHKRPGASRPRNRDFPGPVYTVDGRDYYRNEDGDCQVMDEEEMIDWEYWPPVLDLN